MTRGFLKLGSATQPAATIKLPSDVQRVFAAFLHQANQRVPDLAALFQWPTRRTLELAFEGLPYDQMISSG